MTFTPNTWSWKSTSIIYVPKWTFYIKVFKSWSLKRQTNRQASLKTLPSIHTGGIGLNKVLQAEINQLFHGKAKMRNYKESWSITSQLYLENLKWDVTNHNEANQTKLIIRKLNQTYHQKTKTMYYKTKIEKKRTTFIMKKLNEALQTQKKKRHYKPKHKAKQTILYYFINTMKQLRNI